jgi:microcompartment protein CcmL/EutN
VLQLVKKEMVIIVVQIDVEEVNGSTSDGIQQSTQIGSPNVDHEYQEPTEQLNLLLLNTPEIIVNTFGIINWVTEEGWP